MTISDLCAGAVLAGAVLMAAGSAAAQSPEDYLGTVVLTGASYCPKGTLEANGAVLPVSGFEGLFSLYGQRFGGDGRSTVGLPNLTAKVPQSGLRYCVVVDGKLPPHG